MDNNIPKIDKPLVYAKEPKDSADYKFLKYDFYLSKSGQLCERKLAMARTIDSTCNCEFIVYYDSTNSIYSDDTTIEKPLSDIVDINSFTYVDSTEYSKDKNSVFYFYGNSGGGTRVKIQKADPGTFKRLCEYRWGFDKKYVFYQTDILDGINLNTMQVLTSPDTSNHFIQYLKDDKIVFFENENLKGADAKTFKVVSGQKWDAEDKDYKYLSGRRYE